MELPTLGELGLSDPAHLRRSRNGNAAARAKAGGPRDAYVVDVDYAEGRAEFLKAVEERRRSRGRHLTMDEVFSIAGEILARNGAIAPADAGTDGAEQAPPPRRRLTSCMAGIRRRVAGG